MDDEQKKLTKAYAHVTFLKRLQKHIGHFFKILFFIIIGLTVGYIVLAIDVSWFVLSHKYLLEPLGLAGTTFSICLIISIIWIIWRTYHAYLKQFSDNVILPNYTERMIKVKQVAIRNIITTISISFSITFFAYVTQINKLTHHAYDSNGLIVFATQAFILVGLNLLFVKHQEAQ